MKSIYINEQPQVIMHLRFNYRQQTLEKEMKAIVRLISPPQAGGAN
ncbi:hypothetical protein [Paenibacillus sp. J2TS4]|nr:hypothetical protein [Paenibacillus sp. J2TS4]